MTKHESMRRIETTPRRFAYGAFFALWTAALVFGWWQTMRYEYATSDWKEASYAQNWPSDSALARVVDRPTLLVFLHPKCPCTYATLNELDRCLAARQGNGRPRPRVQLIATVPGGSDESWSNTRTVARGRDIAEGNIYVDSSGLEATRFGVTTSGTLLLFDESGERRFAGGITVSRGHEGQSSGADCLRKLLDDRNAGVAQSPVFGCRLCLPDEEVRNTTPPAAAHTLMNARSVPNNKSVANGG